MLAQELMSLWYMFIYYTIRFLIASYYWSELHILCGICATLMLVDLTPKNRLSTSF